MGRFSRSTIKWGALFFASIVLLYLHSLFFYIWPLDRELEPLRDAFRQLERDRSGSVYQSP